MAPTIIDRMRKGHLARTGHELVAHLEPREDDSGIMIIVRECC